MQQHWTLRKSAGRPELQAAGLGDTGNVQPFEILSYSLRDVCCIVGGRCSYGITWYVVSLSNSVQAHSDVQVGVVERHLHLQAMVLLVPLCVDLMTCHSQGAVGSH